MYKEHPLFEPPPSDAVLWRYMDFTKFVSLLDRRALFFCRADKLGDPFEGSYTKFNVEMRPTVYMDTDIPQHALQQLFHIAKESRRFTLLSCWHWGEHESAAMWGLYSGEHDGIAVKTDFEALTNCVTTNEDIFIGKVNYIDYNTTGIPEDNLLAPYVYKRKSFEHEREVRAIIQKIPSMGSSDDPSADRNIDISQDLYDVGLYVPVDLSMLVHEVLVGRLAPDWFLELTTSVTALYGLKVPVKKSSLSGEPVWG